MEQINKGYIFRLYPTDKQMELIEKSFGCSRYIYNYFLGKNNGYINSYNIIKEIPKLIKDKPWLKEVDSCLLRTSIFNLESSFKRYNNKLSKYPKFKSKIKTRPSYRTNNITSTYKGRKYNSISVDLEKKIVKLPKLIPSKIIGIDLGIKDLVITSDGETIENRKYQEKYENKIKGLNRWLSRCKSGSKNRYKVKLKLQTVYKKLKNARKYLIHNISNKLIKENDIITTESLKINEMVQNKKFSKQIYDASWYELIRQLEYKSRWQGKKLYKIETYYPSSQICSRCGYQNKKVKDLSIRNWGCPECRNENNRDINASINIMVDV